MPSQEENLENLMKDTKDVDLPDINEMSESDIERILQANKQQDLGNSNDLSDTDLFDLLSADESEEELNSIYDMLKKADNNEAIDDSIFQTDDEILRNPLTEDTTNSQKQKKPGFFSKLKDRLSGNNGKENNKEDKQGNKKEKKKDKKKKKAGQETVGQETAGKEAAGKDAAGEDSAEEIMNEFSHISPENPDLDSSEMTGNIEDSIMQDITGQTDELFENMAALDQGLIESLEQDAKDLEIMIPDKDDASARKEQRKEMVHYSTIEG